MILLPVILYYTGFLTSNRRMTSSCVWYLPIFVQIDNNVWTFAIADRQRKTTNCLHCVSRFRLRWSSFYYWLFQVAPTQNTVLRPNKPFTESSVGYVSVQVCCVRGPVTVIWSAGMPTLWHIHWQQCAGLSVCWARTRHRRGAACQLRLIPGLSIVVMGYK